MGTKLSAEDAGAYEALDRLLFRQWDPIGVSDMDGWAEDEYRAYLPHFWSMVSATWSSALMWSHYADEHRGICIEYDTTDQEHPNVGPVSYRAPRAVKASDLALWKGSDDAAAKDRVLQTYFYAKSPEWRYEREWRDVRDHNGIEELPFRITAIHFGLRCDHAVISSMVRLLSDRSQIKLYTIGPKEETFKLRRSRLDAEDIAEINATAISEPGWLTFKDVFWEEELENLAETGGEALPEVPDPAL
ncbi:DUF2971 domain-containing protein [Brevundimonas vesicularis]|uniref:DUF2971 domain-containing protein n=2 Tax=Brevundimonas TaxID=41275 RepID=UPI00289E3A0C|nr:DUF2971 domain-containing protein [Brevundimonas vesicularis]